VKTTEKAIAELHHYSCGWELQECGEFETVDIRRKLLAV